jgi:hypothetical protein
MSHVCLRANFLKASVAKARNCRNFLTSSRDQGNALAERLDKQWRELRRHVTIESDPEKMFQLTAEFARRKRQREAVDKLSDRIYFATPNHVTSQESSSGIRISGDAAFPERIGCLRHHQPASGK